MRKSFIKEGEMNIKIWSFLVSTLVIFFTLNCISKESLAEEKNVIQKTEQVVVVSNPKTPKSKMRIVFKEELSIGKVEGDENYMFGSFIIFNTDKEGNFYITDWDRRRIQKYDNEGKYLLTIGRQGQGPGEFQNLTIARFDKDGHFYVTDLNSRRISFFDTDGKYLRQILIPDVFENLYMNSRGYFVASCSKLLGGEVGMGWRIVDGLFDEKFNPVAEFNTRIFNPKPPEGRDLTSMAKFTAGILNLSAFQPQPIHTVADNGYIYFGYPENYLIDIYSPAGKKTKTIERKYDPIEVGEKDKEYFVSNIAEDFVRGRPEDLKKETIRFIQYPKFKPAYHRFALMENGWLAVVVEFIENEYTLFDLFDEEGTYIGNFKANIPPDGLFFKNGKAYAIAIEEGYQFAKRYSFEVQEYRDNKWVKK
jgi:hypothetical protein